MSAKTTITLRIIDGTDKGRDFVDLPLPVSLGREVQNSVRIRDEKVSRYHCRIQEENGEIILTDIDSTNGTLLNGQPIHIALLHPGDLIAIGQTLIIVGTRKEIAKRLALLDELDMQSAALRLLVSGNEPEYLPETLINEMEHYSYDVQDAMKRLHSVLPPELPKNLHPSQCAELSEIFLYIQLRMRMLIEKGRMNETTNRVSWNQCEWQNFLDLFSRLTDYYTSLTDGEE